LKIGNLVKDRCEMGSEEKERVDVGSSTQLFYSLLDYLFLFSETLTVIVQNCRVIFLFEC
jgi:hypothetical protein